MYCKKCGAKIDDDSLFCKECGEKIIDKQTEQVNEDVEKILNQTEINKKLAKFDEITEPIICPICGYKGGMGLVSKNIAPMHLRILAWICVLILSEIIVYLFQLKFKGRIIICGVCYEFIFKLFKAQKRKFICPNCDSELFDK